MTRWYNAFAGLGEPLTLPEWGIDDDQGVQASRGPAIRASRTWLTTHNFHIISYWQLDNWYLDVADDADGVAAYQELVAAAAP
ncbi:hypothetical protein ACIA5D_18040 [Actinoplanes sp. NPDC051513]|uniref:hypothetical protein n=1 Tax=Actinoplanes sp. NPDC051513 TaxID=3363908 RepID=UPI00379FCEC4